MNRGSRDEVSFADRDLQHQIMQLRNIDNITNLIYLAREYVLLAGVAGGAIFFAESRAGWGLSWCWNVPVFLIAIVVMGALQHRLAGLGHEASHYTFMKNRFLNDFIPDLFCMFPLLTTVHFYRVFHMAHHQFTNDPERDPDLLNLGHGKRASEFPMTRGRFIAMVYFCILTAPARFLHFQLAYIAVNALGKGRSVYCGTEQGGHFSELYLPRLGTVLGLVYLVAINVPLGVLARGGRSSWIVPAGGVAGNDGSLPGGQYAARLGAFLIPLSPSLFLPLCQCGKALLLHGRDDGAGHGPGKDERKHGLLSQYR